ncbi:MAG: hypothetical protein V1913_07995 [Fibrobacterota bacterium]
MTFPLLVLILLAVLGITLLVTALKMPKNFVDNESKRRLFRQKRRDEEKEEVLK